MREDPDRAGLLYAGTEYGLFISMDDGQNWHSFQNNLPVTPITDLKVHQKDLVISTMGRSFWVLDDLSVLHQLADNLADNTAHLFQPRDEYRLRYRSTSKKSIPYYPTNSVNINYFLKTPSKGSIQLDILNKEGQIVRSFKSAAVAKKEVDKERNMSTEFSGRGTTSLLKTKAGLQQFHWDMRHEGVWDKDPKRSGRNGPLVAPGEYTARLKANGQTFHETFSIKMDPKVANNGTSLADLTAQEKLNLQVRDQRTLAKQTLNNVEKTQAELAKIDLTQRSKAQQKKLDQLDRIIAEFVTEKGRYHKPMLLDQFRYLNYMISTADQKPGDDAYQRLEELSSLLQGYIATYRNVAKIKGKISTGVGNKE